MAKNFWHNKRVLVTGGNGFLGKYILRKLNERGADVFVVRQDCYDPSALLRAGLRDSRAIRRALSDSKPQTLMRA